MYTKRERSWDAVTVRKSERIKNEIEERRETHKAFISCAILDSIIGYLSAISVMNAQRVSQRCMGPTVKLRFQTSSWKSFSKQEYRSLVCYFVTRGERPEKNQITCGGDQTHAVGVVVVHCIGHYTHNRSFGVLLGSLNCNAAHAVLSIQTAQ